MMQSKKNEDKKASIDRNTTSDPAGPVCKLYRFNFAHC